LPRVAILGWGSLLWDRGTLQVSGNWKKDGPSLPIEFARTSGLKDKEKPPYLSLVLHPDAGLIRTYWDVSFLTEHRDDAICDLRKRERCTLSDIAHLPADTAQSPIPGVDLRIREWLLSKRAQIDAVIWTNLPPKLEQRQTFIIEESIAWLDNLRANNRQERAQQYIQRAPSQTDTCLRRQVRERFHWTDIDIGF